ncbi:hypothetical protein A3736_13235 [Erythrobacter sp. HI0063]|jgi:hypothetical protein|uniref:hypothetical protein n=1 Tax=Erythrobacter sp. HI0063 TaxID=1822240 RepID=UPI0007C330E1|nr:hypothetical protein [Erythrobacter sp. HI0063]KZY54796.1 hypothetical protein A3736_13235 [Erythrobacter sp. HI0063]
MLASAKTFLLPMVLILAANRKATQIREDIYPTGSQSNPSLGYAYQYEHLSMAKMRLKQGGIRLAAYLDSVFAER